jgi:glycosyltransferase involved in cell wall biosynthesis/O-antigen/teichoic acid export membrane protein
MVSRGHCSRPLRILVLADRDWTHPQGGGSGANLFAQIARWVHWGHDVTVVAGEYAGAKTFEQLAPNLVVHRMGGRATVFPRAILAVLRGLGRDADIVLEVINGIPFLTPLWLRKPCVALVHHVHRELYVEEFGFAGRLLSWLLETLPLRYLYRRMRFLTISEAAQRDLVDQGVPAENITVAYLGVEPGPFRRGERAPHPQLIYLGRLKQYKRIEYILDVLETIPDAHLDIVGEGDHRPALEAEIIRRGLSERVVLHGHVDEDRKTELYGRAWVSLTASSSEGWSLTVMEAALCGTPSAALAVGGLPESIVDAETGILAHDRAELAARVREVIAQPELRARLSDAAEARAKTFTWERAARTNVGVLRAEACSGRPAIGAYMTGSDTAKATAVACATLAGHALGLVFTLVFARMLGAAGYGALAAVMSAFIMLSIPGAALQVATARDAALGRLGADGAGAATLRSWTRTLTWSCVALALVAIPLRRPLADALGVSQAWAAAALLPTGALWMLVSIQRGALQGLRRYRAVGWSIVVEAGLRLGLGIVLVLVGAGVAGAFLGTPLSLLIITLLLGGDLRRELGRAEAGGPTRRLREQLGAAGLPVVGLTLLAVVQNLDVIVLRHGFNGPRAGSYAAAAVAAKTLVWVAVGIGLYLLPEATRVAASGQDPRPVLRRSLVAVTVLCAPVLVLFAVAPHPLLSLAFGSRLALASGQLPVLALAMALLAVAALTVQYMLALGRMVFVPVLGVIALVEPFVLGGVRDLPGFAALVLLLQLAAAAALLGLSLRPVRVSATA